MRSSSRRSRLSPRDQKLYRLANQVSAVINRVRRAYGSTSMSTFSARAEVQQAEQQINQMACRLLGGKSTMTDWYQTLKDYEALWMGLLDENLQAERHAA